MRRAVLFAQVVGCIHAIVMTVTWTFSNGDKDLATSRTLYPKLRQHVYYHITHVATNQQGCPNVLSMPPARKFIDILGSIANVRRLKYRVESTKHRSDLQNFPLYTLAAVPLECPAKNESD